MFPFKKLQGAIAVVVLCLAQAAFAQVNVLTYHNDNARTGANLNETILTPANVNQNTFGKLFTYNVDGYVYAQPLYVSGLNISGQGVHNAVFVATEHNSVYCFDADSNAGTNGGVLWQANLGPSAACPVDGFEFRAITNEVGITGTPVIDPVSQTLYVDAFTFDGTNYFHKIHALDITDGSEKSFSPVTVNVSIPGNGAGSSGGMLPFQAIQQLQRSALTLAGNVLYVAYAGYTDTPNTDPFHGWVIGFDASSLTLLSDHVFNTTPNGTSGQFGAIAGEGGIWMGDSGPAVDSNNNIYFAVGDGNFNASSGGTEYGDSVVQLSTTNGFSVVDYFTTWNQEYYRTHDLDVGSGGVMLLPDQPGPYPHLMIAAGKPQYAYFLNRDQMTTDNRHFNSGGGSDNILQTMSLGGGCYTAPAYFNERIYYGAGHDVLRYYVVSNATLIPDLPGTFGTRVFPFPGASPSISANGTNDGIAWTLEYTNSAPAILSAYNATNLSTEIYNSTQTGTRDQLGGGVKFAVPTVANGKVYVAGQFNLSVFGLLGGGLQFSTPNYTVPDNTNSVTVTVNRVGGSQGAVQVSYATIAGGTAIDGQDYTNISGTLNWADGDASPQSFDIALLPGPPAATNKTIFLTLSNATSGAYIGIQSNAVLTIVESAYNLWKFSHFGTNASDPSIAGDLDDPDQDGVPNLLEFAFGSDPNSPNPSPTLTGAIVTNLFQLQFDRNTSATDLTYTIEATPVINGDWSNVMTCLPGTGWVTNTPGATVTESDPSGSPPDEHVQVTITDPTDVTSTNRFFHLKVQP
jgi:Calx-beta domain